TFVAWHFSKEIPMRQPTRVALLLGLLTSTAALGIVDRGYVEVPYTPTVCLQESHFLIDPCTGYLNLLLESATLDLDPFACNPVVVDGPDIGITCPVIRPDSVVAFPPPGSNH